MSIEKGVELEHSFGYGDNIIVHKGDEVYVCGIGGKMLGIGKFAGGLVLLEPDGNRIVQPILEVQERLIAGGDVDLWSIDARLIAEQRGKPVYPIKDYIEESDRVRDAIVAIGDMAIAEQMGVEL